MQDRSTPFSQENVKPVPDKPGLWFYQATRLPVAVVEKDGQLYFQGGQEGEEEMLVSEFGMLKETYPDLKDLGFVMLQPTLQTGIVPATPQFSAN